MRKLLYNMYELYVQVRQDLDLNFVRHRTHTAIQLAAVRPMLAWQQAVKDNRGVGNPYLPSSIKAGLEVLGVSLLALYGLRKRGRLLALIALCFLAQTASQQSGGGGGGSEEDEDSGGDQQEGEDSAFGDPDFWEGFTPEQRRKQELFDKLNEEVPYQEGEEWPDCDCGCGCQAPAANIWGGQCSNCLEGFHG